MKSTKVLRVEEMYSNGTKTTTTTTFWSVVMDITIMANFITQIVAKAYPTLICAKSLIKIAWNALVCFLKNH